MAAGAEQRKVARPADPVHSLPRHLEHRRLYILGLGVRHPSNLMLEKLTGRLFHVDFGDCFDVAMHREKYPEKVPFRLTRMLVNAMEVCGIEGNFRATCEEVMHVVRDNTSSLMAMLEAFVHDPLVNWRLLPTQTTLPGEDVIVQMDGSQHHPQGQQSHEQQQHPINTVGPLSSEDPQKDHVDIIADGEEGVSQQKEDQASQQAAGGLPGDDPGYSNGNMRDTRARRDRAANLQKVALIAAAGMADSDTINDKAVQVLNRVSCKLSGLDFPHAQGKPHEGLAVDAQVELLIQQAISHENLCQAFVGWCPFW